MITSRRNQVYVGEHMLTNNPHETAAYLQKVMEHSPALIYVFNQEIGQNEYSNQNVRRVLGYTSEEVLRLGLDLMTENLHPEDATRVMQHMEGLRDLKDGEVRSVEFRMRHRDGHWIWLLTHDAVFQRNEQGLVTHHIGTAIDITETKSEEELQVKLSA